MGLPTEGTKGIYDDDGSTMPASPEIFRQSSEEQLLGTAGSIGMVRKVFDCHATEAGGWAARYILLLFLTIWLCAGGEYFFGCSHLCARRVLSARLSYVCLSPVT